MKKPWFVLPGYCVGLGSLVLITYRTALAVSSPEKAIMVSVNRFGEASLDLVALGFLWLVCLIGLLCLSSWVREMKRQEDSHAVMHTDGTASPVVSFDRFDLAHQRSMMTLMGTAHDGFNFTDTASVSVHETESRVSVSVVIQQEDIQG
jgi:hypothetical protein